MWPFKTRREQRLEAELDAVNADRERIRGERNQFAKDRDTYKAAAKTAARQFAEADATNRRLHGRILELGRRISQLTESDPEYAARLERRVARLLKVAARLYAGGRAEKLRADHLQKELDNALGMPPGGLLDSAPWQPGYQAPTPQAKAVAS